MFCCGRFLFNLPLKSLSQNSVLFLRKNISERKGFFHLLSFHLLKPSNRAPDSVTSDTHTGFLFPPSFQASTQNTSLG